MSGSRQSSPVCRPSDLITDPASLMYKTTDEMPIVHDLKRWSSKTFMRSPLTSVFYASAESLFLGLAPAMALKSQWGQA